MAFTCTDSTLSVVGILSAHSKCKDKHSKSILSEATTENTQTLLSDVIPAVSAEDSRAQFFLFIYYKKSLDCLDATV